MARRPKKSASAYQHSKPQTITSPDGWTHVHRGPSIKHANSHPSARSSAATQALIGHRPFTSLSDLEAHYARIKESLEKDSPAVKEYRARLEGLVDEREGLRVERVLCLGLGSFVPGVAGDVVARQLGLLEACLETLKGRGRIRGAGEVYFQDPVFTALDVKFLTGRGYHVIPYPPHTRHETLLSQSAASDSSRSKPISTNATETQGQASSTARDRHGRNDVACADYLSEHTFLYTPHLEWATAFRVLGARLPALFIGPRIPDFEDRLRESFRGDAAEAEGQQEVVQKLQDERLRSVIEGMEWTVPVKVTGPDFNWCNNLDIAVRTAVGLGDHETVGAQIAEEQLGTGFIDKQENDELKAQTQEVCGPSELEEAYKAVIKDRAASKPPVHIAANSTSTTNTLEIMLADKKIPDLPTLTGAVCFNLTSFTQSLQRQESKAFEHLADLEQLLASVRNAGFWTSGATVYVVDASFEKSDVLFLLERGFQVVPIPKHTGSNTEYREQRDNEEIGARGYVARYLTEGMLVFAPTPDLKSMHELITKGKPSLFLGTLVMESRAQEKSELVVEESDECTSWVKHYRWYKLDVGRETCFDFGVRDTRNQEAANSIS